MVDLDPDPWNPYYFYGFVSVSKISWICNLDPYMLQIFLLLLFFFPGSGSESYLTGSGFVSKFVLDPDP